jgi:uncharacterized protein
MRLMIAVIAFALGLSACTQHAPAAPPSGNSSGVSVHPESGLRVIDLSVTSGSKLHRFRVEVASTSQQQQQGLMFRKTMGADEGMLFPMWPARTASFWMKNTVLPLDIIFIGPDNRVLNIAYDARPYDESPLVSVGQTRAVLELNAGRARALGIAPGDVVRWQEQD